MLFLFGLAVSCVPILAQVTARQGERDPNAFFDSMIIEGPFPPAIPDARAKKDWFSTADYEGLWKYQCDRLRVTEVEFRLDKVTKDGKLPVKIRISLSSPDQNHDKAVDVLFEIHNGDSIVGSEKTSFKVKEGGRVEADVRTLLLLSDLKVNPTTQLRITLHTKDV